MSEAADPVLDLLERCHIALTAPSAPRESELDLADDLRAAVSESTEQAPATGTPWGRGDAEARVEPRRVPLLRRGLAAYEGKVGADERGRIVAAIAGELGEAGREVAVSRPLTGDHLAIVSIIESCGGIATAKQIGVNNRTRRAKAADDLVRCGTITKGFKRSGRSAIPVAYALAYAATGLFNSRDEVVQADVLTCIDRNGGRASTQAIGSQKPVRAKAVKQLIEQGTIVKMHHASGGHPSVIYVRRDMACDSDLYESRDDLERDLAIRAIARNGGKIGAHKLRTYIPAKASAVDELVERGDVTRTTQSVRGKDAVFYSLAQSRQNSRQPKNGPPAD